VPRCSTQELLRAEPEAPFVLQRLRFKKTSWRSKSAVCLPVSNVRDDPSVRSSRTWHVNRLLRMIFTFATVPSSNRMMRSVLDHLGLRRRVANQTGLDIPRRVGEAEARYPLGIWLLRPIQ